MSERKCVLGSCCCGCSLRTGAWVTAIVCLIGAIVQAANNINDAIRNSHQSSWVNVIIALIMLVIAIMLFLGVYKSNPRFLWIWVYVQFVLTIIALVVLFITGGLALAIVPIIVGAIIYGIIIYFILVVRSYAIELEGTGGGNTV